MTDFFKAVTQVWKERQKERRRGKRLVKEPLDYDMLQEMIDACGKDMEIQIVRNDNTVIFIRRRTQKAKDSTRYYR